MEKVAVILASAGSGTRLSGDVKKQYLLLDGKPILYHTIKKFDDIEAIESITIVCDIEGMNFVKNEIIEKYDFRKSIRVVVGGLTRTASVIRGLESLESDTSHVLIHDGVRPFINKEVIKESIKQTLSGKSVVVCSKTVDTIKIVEEGKIINTLDRNLLWNAETPQCFSYELIIEKMREAVKTECEFTDEASILEYFGLDVHIVENVHPNIKITLQKDLRYGQFLLNKEI